LPQPTSIWGSLLTIALSAVVSMLVAWLTSRRTMVVEREKTRLAAEQSHLEVLVQARLKEYPALYALLSDLPKAFDRWPTVTIDLPNLLTQFNQWDSQHSILMSLETSNCCNRFRMALVDAVFQGREPSEKDRFADLRTLAEHLELALRSDLGIHGITLLKEHLAAPRPKTY
jgi:hypothetical protein